MATVRARLIKRGFGLALAAQGRFSRNGLQGIDPDLPQDELEAIAVVLRNQINAVVKLAPPPRRTTVHEDRHAPVPGEWVQPKSRFPERVVMHLHGGAYVLCSPRTHRGLTSALAIAADARVFVPDYRLAPEHRFPAALDDAVATYRWLVEDLSIDPSDIAVTGDSAGGGLGLALLLKLRDDGFALPACYGGMSPWTDLAATGDSHQTKSAHDPMLPASLVVPTARAYAGAYGLDHPLVSPLYADLHGLPPMLVHVGSEEILYDDARRLVEKARQAGIDASYGEFPGLWHVFHAFPGFPEARNAIRELGAFIRRHTSR